MLRAAALIAAFQGAAAAPAASSELVGLSPGEEGAPDHLTDYIHADQPILYAVSTGQIYHATRADAVARTWCSTINSCVFYSDAPNTGNVPVTIPIDLSGLEGRMTPMRLAQLRYLRILRHAGKMVLDNRGNLFAQTQWIVIADDDTYIFHYNLLAYLNTLDATQPIYTGHTLSDKVYPVNGDGDGHTLSVSITQHFACGGGGSVFSKSAIDSMVPVSDSCITDSLPGGVWDGWQSDWMFGACAARAGVPLLDQPTDRFGQFLYQPNHVKHQMLPDDPGTKQFCQLDGGRCAEPVSLHPLHDPKGMFDLNAKLPDSDKASVQDVRIFLLEDGSVHVD